MSQSPRILVQPSSLPSARLAAVQVLVAVESGHTTLATELDRAVRNLDDERDRGLAMEIAAGTLRWRARLDALLAPCSARPVDELSPEIRAILRTGVYQLDHLDRVPAHAVLHEAVELSRALGHPRAARFVNAVLRTFQRDRPRLALPARPAVGAPSAAFVNYLSVSLSHPSWLVSRWIDRYGFEAAEAWCTFNNTTPDIAVHPTGGRTADELIGELRLAGVSAESAPFLDDAVRLPPGGLGRIPAALRDELFVQDEASQMVAHAVGATAGQRVLDLCAAPGGKTVVLAADQPSHGLLVACDFRPRRVRLLRRTLAAASVAASTVRLDATRPLPFDAAFDQVFVDAPCSGLGILRREPDLKWSRSPDDLPALAATQSAILHHAAGAVRPGGRLVYATCSSEPEENDEVIEAFLGQDRRFGRVPIAVGPHLREGALVIDPTGLLRTLPFRDRLDAFFAAALVRRAGA